MLAKKIRSLLNGGAREAGVDGLSAAIDAIAAETAIHKAELAQIPKLRGELAFADDGEAQCAALTARETELYTKIEIAEIRIAKLREKLSEQINLRRLDRIEHHRREAAEKFEALGAALMAAVEANEAATQAYAAACAELGGGDAFLLVQRADYLPPGAVVRDMVAHWQATTSRELDGAARTAPRSPALKEAATKAPPGPFLRLSLPHGDAGKGPVNRFNQHLQTRSPKLAEKQAPAIAKSVSPPKPRVPIRDEARPGEVLVELLRSDYEDPAQRRCARGDVISLPPDTARSVVGNGVAEFVKGNTV